MSIIGSKAAEGTYQRIVCWMPPHDIYIEPFAGHAAVFRHKRPAARSILIDLDPGAIDVIGEAVRIAQGGDGAGTLDRIRDGARATVELIVGDGLEFLRRFQPPDGQRVMVYADPPYPKETRRDVERDYYEHEWTTEQHEAFLDWAVDASSFSILISSYHSRLYAERLGTWHQERFTAMTRGGPALEGLWANYPKPDRLHDYRYIGHSFHGRWRIRKRQRNWARALKKMPAIERRAMLDSLAREFAADLNAGNGDGRPSPGKAWGSAE